MFAVAEEGKLKTVKYMWPKPGETQPSAKESYVTKVGDQVCGVEDGCAVQHVREAQAHFRESRHAV